MCLEGASFQARGDVRLHIIVATAGVLMFSTVATLLFVWLAWIVSGRLS